MSIDDVTEILSIPLIGAIPDDEQVVVATNQGEPVISWIPWPEKPIQIYASVFSALKYLS